MPSRFTITAYNKSVRALSRKLKVDRKKYISNNQSIQSRLYTRAYNAAIIYFDKDVCMETAREKFNLIPEVE